MTDGRDDAGPRSTAVTARHPADPASTASDERILLLECRLAQLRSQLESARVEADLARTKLAEAAAREADHVRRYSAAMHELAEARAEIASLHRRLEHSEALRAQLEGQLFEPDTLQDAEELVRLRRELLVERHRADVNERMAARLRARVEELEASRETILSHLAEWQQLVRRDEPEAIDLARYLSDLRREILDLESRCALAERREAAYRRRLAMAGIDPDDVLAGLHEGPAQPALRTISADASRADPAQRPEERVDDPPVFELPLRPITAGLEEAAPAGGVEPDIAPVADLEPVEDVEAAEPIAGWHADASAGADHGRGNVVLAAEDVDLVEEQVDVGAEHVAPDIEPAQVLAEYLDMGVEPAEVAAEQDTTTDVELAAADADDRVVLAGAEERADSDPETDHGDADVDSAPDEREAAPVVLAAEHASSDGGETAADGEDVDVDLETAPPVELHLERPAEPEVVPEPLNVLVAALENADVLALRIELRRCVRACGEEAVLDVIRPRTEAANPGVRATAYEALGLLLSRNAAALEPFVRAGLNDPDARVRRRVVLAAAAAQGLPLRSLLEPARVDRDPQVRRVVLEVLRHLPPGADEQRRPSEEPGVLGAIRPVA